MFQPCLITLYTFNICVFALQQWWQVLTSRQLGLRLNTDEMQDLTVQLDPNNSGWAVYGDVVYELATMLLQLVTQNTAQVSGNVWL